MVLIDVVAAIISGLFLFAASFKLMSSAPLRDTLRALGVPAGLATYGSRLAPAAEILLAVAVLGLAPAAVGASLVAVAAVCIGAAGLAGLRSEAPIPCSCLSAHSSTVLGPRQLVLAAGLLAAAPLLAIEGRRWSVEGSLSWLAVASLALAALHALLSTRVLRESVGYRRAAASVYPS